MIPVNEPLLGEKEKELAGKCLDTGWISSEGSYVKEFEGAFASYIGQKYGVAVCNGTAALEAALQALNLGKGDEVIMPCFTIISCAIAIIEVGAVPVLVDAEPDTWNMDVRQIEQKITGRTKAIMPVHIYGHPVDMDPLLGFARKHNLLVVEDPAEAHGAEYRGRKCGSFGHLSCFSFYANKIITTGEGGMVLTSDQKTAEALRSLRNLYFGSERRFAHQRLGHNYRMTNIQAALGVAQTAKIEELIEIKRRNARLYTERLKNIKCLQLPVEKDYGRNVYWMYGIVLDEGTGLDNAALGKRLAEKGIATRDFFLGLDEQPVLQGMGLFKGERYPVSERLARQGLYLPSGLALKEEQIEVVCAALAEILRNG